MSYSSLSRTSREIVLFSLTCIASCLLNMSYRLILHCSVYCDYDNSSVLLSDKLCTLPCFEFYLFSIYIAVHKKQPYKRIRLSDYLLDNSMSHDLAIMHMVNNIFVGIEEGELHPLFCPRSAYFTLILPMECYFYTIFNI